MKYMLIGIVLVLVGLGFIFYWAYPIQKYNELTINQAIERLGDKGETLNLPRGQWIISENVDWSNYKNILFKIEPGSLNKEPIKEK